MFVAVPSDTSQKVSINTKQKHHSKTSKIVSECLHKLKCQKHGSLAKHVSIYQTNVQKTVTFNSVVVETSSDCKITSGARLALSGFSKKPTFNPYVTTSKNTKTPLQSAEPKAKSLARLDFIEKRLSYLVGNKNKAALADLSTAAPAKKMIQDFDNLSDLPDDARATLQKLKGSLPDPNNNNDLDRIVENANIYFAIMALVRQLILQSEDQARDVLRVIKERKKDIDALGDLLGAFTMAQGAIDYSKDPHMRDVIDRAVAVGVPIEPGKYTFTSTEREGLLKAIEMKRGSIESYNQTEMVTLQEKQSRFNSLQEMLTHLMKQLEHVIRTIVGNYRPG